MGTDTSDYIGGLNMGYVKSTGTDSGSISEANFLVVGYTCQDHLLIDLDGCSLYKADRIARMIREEWPWVGMCLVVESSPMHHHLVYDSKLPWGMITSIVQTLAALGVVEKNYAQVRTFRRDLTLRVSDKHGVERYRPVPKPLYLIGYNLVSGQPYGVRRYLQTLQAFINLDEFARRYPCLQRSLQGTGT
jgi:hypothetical protein